LGLGLLGAMTGNGNTTQGAYTSKSTTRKGVWAAKTKATTRRSPTIRPVTATTGRLDIGSTDRLGKRHHHRRDRQR
jgi:hypothetical protein